MTIERLDLEAALAALRSGAVVAVPTDTVYGVAARLDDPAAVSRLFAVKSRPRDVALPVLVASRDDVSALGLEWSESAEALAREFWPGALTIVVAAPALLAQRVGATNSLGVRQPRHSTLLELLARTGPLAVTSANEHGQAPCTSFENVAATAWAAPIAGVLDAGVCQGVVSSVVELRGEQWRLRRAGAITAAQIAAVLGPESATFDN